jgi:hypothetical protein
VVWGPILRELVHEVQCLRLKSPVPRQGGELTESVDVGTSDTTAPGPTALVGGRGLPQSQVRPRHDRGAPASPAGTLLQPM